MEMFERAAREKLRINYKGICTVEDLWDLSVEELDKFFIILNKNMKETQGESLLNNKKTNEDSLEQLTINIIKHIVTTKLEEQAAREATALNTARKRRLMEIVAKKQDEGLQGMSIEELNKMIDEL